MKTLVTGGAGFIGSHLVDRLLDDGHDVLVLDDFSKGNPANLSHLENNQRLTIHRVNVSEHHTIAPLFSGVEWVIHLAALADIVPSVEEPLKYHRANVDGTVAVLESSRKAAVKRFVYAVSSSCYGLPDEFPTTETAQIMPTYPYALTKNVAEQYVLHWQQLYGMPCVALRLFNVYGPRAKTSGAYGAVFGVFLAQKLAGKPLTVVGDGSQTRDFTFVTDVVDAMVQAADSQISGEVFNVGSGFTYSISYLANLLGGEVVHLPKRPGEPDCTFADIGKIKNMLGWQPKISFEEGVGRMLEAIDQWRDAPLWDSESIAEATSGWFKYLSVPTENQSSVNHG